MILPFFRFAWEFLKIQWAKLLGYEMIAPSGVIEHRWGTCKRCSDFDGTQCLRCSCLVEAKVMLATSKCPKGLWPSIWLRKRLTAQ
jgi:hypothetical protein